MKGAHVTFSKKNIAKGGSMTKFNLEGREVNNTKEIVQGVENFYQELYNEKEVQISATEEVLNSLERKINTQILCSQ